MRKISHLVLCSVLLGCTLGNAEALQERRDVSTFNSEMSNDATVAVSFETETPRNDLRSFIEKAGEAYRKQIENAEASYRAMLDFALLEILRGISNNQELVKTVIEHTLLSTTSCRMDGIDEERDTLFRKFKNIPYEKSHLDFIVSNAKFLNYVRPTDFHEALCLAIQYEANKTYHINDPSFCNIVNEWVAGVNIELFVEDGRLVLKINAISCNFMIDLQYARSSY